MAVSGSALPTSLTSFVGRTRETDELVGLLDESWLVTLLGVGGAGKTRLAVHAAAVWRESHDSDVWFCDLAQLDSDRNVHDYVALAVDASRAPGLSAIASITDTLAQGDGLLLLDNCEHVLDAVAELVLEVGRGAPGTTVIATSRTRLGVAGERVLKVGPLEQATELFTTRAREGDSDADVDDHRLIDQICDRLDRIPLAIELAAMLTRALSVSDIAQGLDDLHALLPEADRGIDPRHVTLATTLDWSRSLLPPDLRHLADELTVFAGSFDTHAVSAIATPHRASHTPAAATHQQIAALVDCSMLTVVRVDGHSRFRMLETLRQHGIRQLEDDHVKLLRDRHVEYYRAHALLAVNDIRGGYAGRAYEWFRLNWADLRAATRWATANAHITAADDLVAAAHEFAWWSFIWEVGEWADDLIEAGSSDMRVIGTSAFWIGLAGDPRTQHDIARSHLEAAGWAKTGPTSWLWTNFAASTARMGDPTIAHQATKDSLEANRLLSVGQEAFWTGCHAASVVHSDPAEAQELLEKIRQLIATTLVAPHHEATSLLYAARAHALLGSHREAIECNRRASELADQYNIGYARVAAITNRAFLAAHGLVEKPADVFREALSTSVAARNWYETAGLLKDLARWWTRNGRPEAADVVRKSLAANDPASDQSVGLDRDQLREYVVNELRSGARLRFREASGGGVEIEFERTIAVVRELIGIGYLRVLVARPGQPIRASMLAAGTEIPPTSRQPLLDEQATKALKGRVGELLSEIESARSASEDSVVDQLELEMHELVAELERTSALGARTRNFSDHDERARSAVGKAIRRAIHEITNAHPAAGQHLQTAVSTGTSCLYLPPQNHAFAS